MSNLDAAQEDFDKKDKRLRYGLAALLFYVVILMTFVAIQTLVTQSTIARNQSINAKASEDRFARYNAENAKQHQITQEYIKCIAQTLLLPIDQRVQITFDNCSVKANADTKAAGGSDSEAFLAPASSSTPSALPNNNQAVSTPPPQQTTTSSPPPDPETTPAVPPAISIVTPLLAQPVCVLGLLCVQ